MQNLKTFMKESLSWVAFNVARSSMPQINDISTFEKFLNNLGITHVTNAYPITSDLFKPTQKDYNQEKVDKLKQVLVPDIGDYHVDMKPLIASEDGYILDGHHRYYALLDSDYHAPVMVVSLPINKLLKLAINFVEDFQSND